ncbi:MAG: prepilin-type N-terminal cleavage/methylation domain-containing protein [bacterium]|nr:prepilin-type N-terminal cleavage/methylation domain-containing protein [bacterium]
MRQKTNGFTLVEILVVILIIAILATIMINGPMKSALGKARDAKRKADLSQVGKLLTLSCYVPDGGEGDYDLVEVVSELKTKNPQYASSLKTPLDPLKGTEAQSFYRYIVNTDKKCAVYANLENESDPVTLSGLTLPTPGGGPGVFKADDEGWNGTNKYFQVSN